MLRSLPISAQLRRVIAALLSIIAAIVGALTAQTYISRMSHHEGYHLVAVDDAVATLPQRPRHAVLVVADGLRRDRAAGLHAVSRLRAAGQCRQTDVGPITVSRPVYAVLSTGLEQDRTGARNNDEKSPLAAESLWQVARRAGLLVTGTSELPWFQQLFPDGFDRFRLVPRQEDPFSAADLAALSLIHPVYIDEAGHEHGAASPAYGAAAARLDREFLGLLDRLDLSRDLVLFTADHGHSDRGGHGGRAEEIGVVLTCIAGPGVRRLGDAAPMDARAIAPTLALLLGLPFPRHMRAGDDALDVLWDIVSPAAFPSEYLAQRRAALARFRGENRAVLMALGSPSWGDFYEKERRAQALWAAACAVALFLLLSLALGRRVPAFLAWTVAEALVLITLFVHFRGSFDSTAINQRRPFILWTSALALLCALLALGVRACLRWSWDRAASEQLMRAWLLVGLCAAHVFVYGWPLGFPVPGPVPFFLPFFLGLVLLWHGLLALVLALIPLRR